MIVRRRPFVRSAVVGGTAYVAGKHAASRDAQISSAQEQAQQAQQTAEEAQQQARTQPAASSPPTPVMPSQSHIDQLTKLAAMHDSGALTDAEFAQEKQRLLAS